MARLKLRSRLRSRVSSALTSALASTSTWLLGRRGDMVWNALIIVTVFLPLAGLAIDIPRYFVLRTRLQIATDAAAEAAARQVDIAAFQNTGETKLSPTYVGEAHWAFEQAVSNLRIGGNEANFAGISVDETADAVTVDATGTIRLFYSLLPPTQVRTTTTSWYRMIRK